MVIGTPNVRFEIYDTTKSKTELLDHSQPSDGFGQLEGNVFFDERSLDGDLVTEFPSGAGAVEVVVDRMSAPYLTGATIDFADRIDAQGFTIDNPNAQGSCACGDSFH